MFISNTTLSPESQLTASIIPQNMPVLPVSATEKHSGILDYKAFINQGCFLSRVFGLRVKTIMIDAGHGGVDRNHRENGYQGKGYISRYSQETERASVEDRHYRVLMTREDDVAVALNNRVEMAKAARADLFISVHSIISLPSPLILLRHIILARLLR